MKSRTGQRGFTLLELMITVAIIAILAALAQSSYSSYVTKARRSDAKVALTKAAARQERYYLKNNTYTANVNDIGGSGGTMFSEVHGSSGSYYQITVSNTGCASGNDGSCFALTATPIGQQASDTECTAFSVNDIGQKQATGTLGNDCW